MCKREKSSYVRMIETAGWVGFVIGLLLGLLWGVWIYEGSLG